MAADACGALVACLPMGMFFGVFAFVSVLIVVGIILGIQAGNKRNEAMQEFAQKNGLAFTPGSWASMPSASGTYKGKPLSLGYFKRTEGSGKHRHTVTFVYAQMTTGFAPDFRLGLTCEQIFSSLFKSIGLNQEIQIGVPEFDQKYLITTNNALRAKRILSPEVRGMINELFAGYYRVKLTIENGCIYYEKETSGLDAQLLQRTADAIATLAGNIEKY